MAGWMFGWLDERRAQRYKGGGLNIHTHTRMHKCLLCKVLNVRGLRLDGSTAAAAAAMNGGRAEQTPDGID